MQLKLDGTRFDEYQIELLSMIVESIKAELQYDITEDKLKELTAKIAFGVCCVIDGSQSMKEDGISPILTFLDGDSEEVISCGGNSYMHEYITSIVKKVFP